MIGKNQLTIQKYQKQTYPHFLNYQMTSIEILNLFSLLLAFTIFHFLKCLQEYGLQTKLKGGKMCHMMVIMLRVVFKCNFYRSDISWKYL